MLLIFYTVTLTFMHVAANNWGNKPVTTDLCRDSRNNLFCN